MPLHKGGFRGRVTVVATIAAFCSPLPLLAQATTVFRGTPSIRVVERGVSRNSESLSSDRASNLVCVVSAIGDRYYWASRENVELVRVESGAFITYLAVNGAGYIRQVNPQLRAVAAAVDPASGTYDYVEHLVTYLGSITYYGRSSR